MHDLEKNQVTYNIVENDRGAVIHTNAEDAKTALVLAAREVMADATKNTPGQPLLENDPIEQLRKRLRG